MATIIIVGDSWGVPNFYGPPGVPETHHTEFLLKDAGHTVYNCAVNGWSNLESLKKAKRLLSGETLFTGPIEQQRTMQYEQPAEYLLWFHTEFMRESNLIDYAVDIDTNLRNIAEVVYNEYAVFINEHNLKLCAIGGQANLRPEFSKYLNPVFEISDWREEILGTRLPDSLHSVTHSYRMIPKLVKDIRTRIELLNDQAIIMDAMRQSSDFPDHCHPGTLPHRDLATKLNSLFNNTQP
jgi:hypothetical protein